MNKQNVIIIGGGAAGLSAAIYLARAGLQPLVFAGSPPGGQLMLTTEVENFPGQEFILGGDLIDIMRKQATKFGTTLMDENVSSVVLVGAVKSVKSASGKTYKAKAVIIATGAKALWMGLLSEKRLRGKGVSACATCDGFFFKNRTVAVIGGGDSALEEALTLTKFASKIYIIHRRAEFKASKIMQKRVLQHKKIEIIWNSRVEEVLGTQRVEGLKLKLIQPTSTNSTDLTIKVDGVFVAIGHQPDTDLFKGQIELDEKGYILTTAMYALQQLRSVKISQLEVQIKSAKTEKTNLSRFQLISTDFNYVYPTMTSAAGVFGAGDCVDHIYKQASTAAGMGVQASLDTERWLGEEIL